MKSSILLLAACLFVASARADDLTAIRRANKQAQPRPAVILPAHGEGAVQWAARLRNPAQAINPLAPLEYGDGTEFVVVDDHYDPFQRQSPGKPRANGIRFFSFTF